MKIILASLLLFMLHSCKPAADRNDWPGERIGMWLEYYGLEYGGFEKTHRFERQYHVTYDYEGKEDDVFSDFYVYAADSVKAIDLDSYHLAIEIQDDGTLYSAGREPDMEVGLIRFEEGKRSRMLFCGTPCIFEEADFDPDGNIVVAGHVENERGYKPVLWVMSPEKAYIEQHEYHREKDLVHTAEKIRYISDIRLSEVDFWHDDKKPIDKLDIPL